MNTELPFNINKKILGFIGVLLILLIVPVTVSFLQQTQLIRQHAQLNNIGPNDSCNKLRVTWKEDIVGQNACVQGQNNPNITSYGVSITVSSTTSTPHHFQYITYKNFCSQGNSSPPCVQQHILGSSGTGVTTQTIQIGPTVMNKCGTVQDDFVITSIDGNTSCHYGGPSCTQAGCSNPGGAGFCVTGIACIQPTPSPIPSPSPSPLPNPTLTIIPTPTIPACNANQGICKWDTNPNATKYTYTITDKNANAVVAQGTVNAPQTSVSFSSTPGKSYVCEVTPVNQCGAGKTGKGEFTCVLPSPTPTACVVPNQPTNVRIICPDCSNTNGGGVIPLWVVSISANASCPVNSVLITYSFTNNDRSFGPMNVVVKDNQTGKSVNLGSVSPGQTKTGQIDTGLTSVKSGTVSFQLSGKGSSDTKTVSYTAAQCSVSSPTPSACPSVGTVNNVTLSCLNCQGQ